MRRSFIDCGTGSIKSRIVATCAANWSPVALHIAKWLHDWREQMLLRCIMWPSLTRSNGQLDPRYSSWHWQTHHHSKLAPRSTLNKLLLISRARAPRVGGSTWVGLNKQVSEDQASIELSYKSHNRILGISDTLPLDHCTCG